MLIANNAIDKPKQLHLPPPWALLNLGGANDFLFPLCFGTWRNDFMAVANYHTDIDTTLF